MSFDEASSTIVRLGAGASADVDCGMCAACGANGGLGSLIRGVGVERLLVITPDGPFRITADRPSVPVRSSSRTMPRRTTRTGWALAQTYRPSTIRFGLPSKTPSRWTRSQNTCLPAPPMGVEPQRQLPPGPQGEARFVRIASVARRRAHSERPHPLRADSFMLLKPSINDFGAHRVTGRPFAGRHPGVGMALLR